MEHQNPSKSRKPTKTPNEIITDTLRDKNISITEKLDQASITLMNSNDEKTMLNSQNRQEILDLAKNAFREKETAIGGNDSVTKTLNKTLDREQFAALGAARALAQNDRKESDYKTEENPFEGNKKLKEVYENESNHAQKNKPKKEPESTLEPIIVGDNPARPIPPELDKNYLIKGNQKKGEYYFKDKPDVVAFKDSGNKITTKTTASSVALSMVSLAESKQWESMKVTGDKQFKREVWLEAKSRGIDVQGYNPTEQDLQQLDTKIQKQNSIEKETEKSSTGVGIASKVTETAVNSANETKAQPKIAKERDIKEELRESYLKLSKQEAIDKHPELEPLYNLEKAASSFVEHEKYAGKFDERGKQRFIEGVRDKALGTLSQGKELKTVPTRTAQSDKSLSLSKEEISR